MKWTSSRGTARTTSSFRRAGISTADQIMCSVSNSAIVLAAAQVARPDAFGYTVLALSAVVVGVACARGLLGTPLLLASGRPPTEVHELGGRSLTVALAVGLLVALGLLLHGTYVNRLQIAIPLAIASPLVLTQDVHRFMAIALGQPMRALFWDAVWAIGSLTILVFAWVGRPQSLAAVLSVWAVGAGVSLIGLSAANSTLPVFSDLIEWWTAEVGNRLRYAIEATVGAVGVFLVAAVTAALVGPAATAAVRGAGTLFGPLSILLTAVPLIVVPESVRQGQSLSSLRAALRRASFVLSGIALCTGIVVMLIPQSWGRFLLGDTFTLARPLFPFTTAEYVIVSWLSTLLTLFRTNKLSRQLLTTRLWFLGFTLVLSSLAALIYGSALAVAASLTLSAGCGIVVGRLILRAAAVAELRGEGEK